jgi:multidrug efflux pump subunit AcrA (membrane-fusion protein)
MVQVRHWALIPVMVLSLATVGCEKKVPEAPPPLTPVKTALVEMLTTRQETRYSGEVIADTQVDLSFRINGFVESIYQVKDGQGTHSVQAGDFVEAQTVLAKVRGADYDAQAGAARAQAAEARASVAAAQAQLDQAKAGNQKALLDFERAERLFNEKSLTKPDYDAARAQRDASTALVQGAQAQLSALHEKIAAADAQVRLAEVPVNETRLLSPISGVVLIRAIEVGSLVAPGVHAFSIADIRDVKVRFGVPDVALLGLRIGQQLAVTTGGVPDVVFRGKVTQITPIADPKGRVFGVQVTIPNPKQQLKPGMVASIAVSQRDSASLEELGIPLSAVVESKETNQYGVFVVEESHGKMFVNRRAIQLGNVHGNRVEVASGLRAGERVVSSGGSLLIEGQEVSAAP